MQINLRIHGKYENEARRKKKKATDPNNFDVIYENKSNSLKLLFWYTIFSGINTLSTFFMHTHILGDIIRWAWKVIYTFFDSAKNCVSNQYKAFRQIDKSLKSFYKYEDLFWNEFVDRLHFSSILQ